MNLNLEYEQDFVKKGKGSKFGSSDFSIKNPRDTKSIQIDKLKNELQKYDITEKRRYEILSEMEKLNSIEYMNMKYLAAVIVIAEEFNGRYQEDETEFIYDFFHNKKLVDKYISKIAETEKENNLNYIKLVKSVLFSYLHKLLLNRKNNYTF